MRQPCPLLAALLLSAWGAAHGAPMEKTEPPKAELMDVFIDTKNPRAVWGRYSDGSKNALFDNKIPVRIRGFDDAGTMTQQQLEEKRGPIIAFPAFSKAFLSPDKSQILFTYAGSDVASWSGLFDRRLHKAWYLIGIPAENAGWSPNGSRIAIQCIPESGNSVILILDPSRPWPRNQITLSAASVKYKDIEDVLPQSGWTGQIFTHLLDPVWVSTSTLKFEVMRVKWDLGPDRTHVDINLGREKRINPYGKQEYWHYDLSSSRMERKD